MGSFEGSFQVRGYNKGSTRATISEAKKVGTWLKMINARIPGTLPSLRA